MMIMHIQSPGIVRTVYSSIFKDILGYWRILMQIHKRGDLPCPFWKPEVSWFWKEKPWSWSALSKDPSSATFPAPLFFCRTLHLKCLTVFWIRLCLDNRSVISTVTLCMYCIRYINFSIFTCGLDWAMPPPTTTHHGPPPCYLLLLVYFGIVNHIQRY